MEANKKEQIVTAFLESSMNTTLRNQVQTISFFHGTPSENVIDWVSTASAFFSGITSIELFLTRLKDGALLFAHEFIAANPEKSLLDLMQALERQFSDPIELRSQLRNPMQSATEAVDIYCGRIIYMNSNLRRIGGADFELSDKELVECFVNGITDRAAKIKVMKKDPKTIHEAYAVASEYVSFNKKIGTLTSASVNTTQVENDDKLRDTVVQLQEAVNALSQAIQNLGSRFGRGRGCGGRGRRGGQRGRGGWNGSPRVQQYNQASNDSGNAANVGRSHNCNHYSHRDMNCHACGKLGHCKFVCRSSANQLSGNVNATDEE
jgi:Icc-related predicted phosphoesterase